MNEALNLLREEAAGLQEGELQKERLDVIIEKLERYVSGIYDHPDDQSEDEKKEKGLAVFLQYVVDQWGDCESIRQKAENESWEYFYYDYTDVPGIDFETFRDFCSDSACWCGHCEE